MLHCVSEVYEVSSVLGVLKDCLQKLVPPVYREQRCFEFLGKILNVDGVQEDIMPQVTHFTQRKIHGDTKEWDDRGCTGSSAFQQMAAVLPE